jgi:PPIC-type PPIASE domain
MLKLVREPLLHFLVAGAALFLLYHFVSDSEPAGDEQIIVTAGHIEHLTTLFLKSRQRLPTDTELKGLIDDFVVEEVLYREAKSIGLDQDDTIIRRRLRQKMEFLFEDFSRVEPTRVELQKFLADNPEQFKTEARITFEHVYFKDSSRAEAMVLLSELRTTGAAPPDDMFLSGLLPPHFEFAREAEIGAQLGRDFASRLLSLEPGKWTGPVDSPFGVHLVYIEEIIPGRLPELDEVTDIVTRDWQVVSRAESEKEILEALRAKYTVTIETLQPEGP